MRVPYSWLQEFLRDLPPPEALLEPLTMLGIPCETLSQEPKAPSGVVVGEIVHVLPLPGSELKLLTVQLGQERLQVVSGAPGLFKGRKVPVALAGTMLPGGVVQVREILGQRSQGTVCSPKELGLWDNAAEVMWLPPDLPNGLELARQWPGDAVLDVEVTPNRADCLSVIGVARDLAAYFQLLLQMPPADVVEYTSGEAQGQVTLEATEYCPRYVAREVHAVKVQPAPLWLQRRLVHAGLRPINNVVDITNYVLWELGQPLHAFDAAQLTSNSVLVRAAQPGETLVTLDGVEHSLRPENVLIATPQARGKGTRGVALAGIMGGSNAGVTTATKDVLLEAAYFAPVPVRRSARILGLSTDASYRFERGIDPNGADLASQRASRLFAELTGATLAPPVTVGQEQPRRSIALRPSYANALLGMQIPPAEMKQYLERLGCEVRLDGTAFQVLAPTYRTDLVIEEDLIEEVIRLKGYNSIPETLPREGGGGAREPALVLLEAVRQRLAASGFQEVVNYGFTSAAWLARVRAQEATQRLMNPLSAEREVMRPALFPSLLEVALASRRPSLAIFEVGRVFPLAEEERLGILLAGEYVNSGWRPGLKADFYMLKGVLEILAAGVGATFQAAPLELAPAYLHPGIAARALWDGAEVGVLGRLHPEVSRDLGLGEIYLAELQLPLSARQQDYQPLAKYPAVSLDVALVAPQEVPAAQVTDLIRHALGEQLESLQLFDVFTGPQVGQGQRSLAFTLTLRSKEKTLSDADVAQALGQLRRAVQAAGYRLREA
ncbi:MAG: phenylalanine--tRNA ligase subunit beta [Deinococcus sp.]|nr:phenylalanine--tRNA ligase subunit beta [Deinococcus sp.]